MELCFPEPGDGLVKNMLNVKNKVLWITTLAFFLIIQTVYYWEGKTEFLDIPITIGLCITYLILFFILIQQIVFLIREKFKDKHRIYMSGTLVAVLILTTCFPSGIIDFEKFEGKDVLIAGWTGSANCTTVLKFKENGKLYKRVTCFGIRTANCKYYVKNDTIFFIKNSDLNIEDQYEFAVIGESTLSSNNKEGLYSFKAKNDTLPNQLIIVYNKLAIKKRYKN
jgi:hypothetical protein